MSTSDHPAAGQTAAPGVAQVQQSDLNAAAQEGLITPEQALALWWRWSAPGSATQARPAPMAAQGSGPRFNFTNTLYYFGGMLAIGAASLFMTLGWRSFGAWGLMLISAAYLVGCLKVADHLKGRQLPIPAGILATLAVVLVPLVVWCAQQGLGLWPPGGPGSTSGISAYHALIDWRWLTLEFATLAAGVVMLWRYRLPFMVMPIAVTLWYMSMDLANGLMQDGNHWDWKFMRDVSLVFGIATCCIAVWVDIRSRRAAEPDWHQDYAFWLYLYGAIMFWGGLSLHDSASEWGKLLYCAINLALVFWGAAIGRRVFTVLGGLGVAMYLGHLSYQVFKDSLMFPFALSLLGLGLVWLGVWWQRHEAQVQQDLSRWVPRGLRDI